jgi:Glycine cleavage system protein P (pyridoxal-binding), C-terminal domain
LNLKKIGVDAVHNNLHKTWSISHGGGGPGDAFVAVDEKLKDYIPSYVVEKVGDKFNLVRPAKSIGSLHSFFGNFAHKIRALTYLLTLGGEGVQAMSANAVLAARYMFERLKPFWKSLPANCENAPRMHEFILTLTQEDFDAYKTADVEQNQATARTGKLFLDYGFHAPTVAFPEVYGLMIEPTESYTKAELDRLCDAIISIQNVIRKNPKSAALAPRFTPIDRVDETEANRKPVLFEKLERLPEILPNRKSPALLAELEVSEIEDLILKNSSFI